MGQAFRNAGFDCGQIQWDNVPSQNLRQNYARQLSFPHGGAVDGLFVKLGKHGGRGQKTIASALKNFFEVVGEIAIRRQIKQQIGVERQLLSGSKRLHK